MSSRWDDALERTDTAVAERTERVLSDQRFPTLRTRRARVALVRRCSSLSGRARCGCTSVRVPPTGSTHGALCE